MSVSISGATISGGVNLGSIPAFTYYRWQITAYPIYARTVVDLTT